MKTSLMIIMAIVFAGSTMFTSCQKDKFLTNPNLSVAEDDANTDNLYGDVQNESDEVVTDLENNGYKPSGIKSADAEGIRSVTVNKPDSSSFPKVITIQFTNWTDHAGRIKNGKIVITVTGPYRKEGSVKTITFDNFTIDDNKVEGTRTVTNLGRNAQGNLQYHVILDGGMVTTETGKSISRSCDHIRTWVSGEITPKMIWDDVYTIEGMASGVNQNGLAFTRTITSPLLIAADCPWIAKGSVLIVVDTKSDVTIDFGSSESVCDNLATVTVNGESREIKLHKGKKRMMMGN